MLMVVKQHLAFIKKIMGTGQVIDHFEKQDVDF